MPRDNSDNTKIPLPSTRLSLSLLSSPTATPNLCSDEQVSVCPNEALTSLLIQFWHVWTEVSFHWQGRLLLLGGYNHL